MAFYTRQSWDFRLAEVTVGVDVPKEWVMSGFPFRLHYWIDWSRKSCLGDLIKVFDKIFHAVLGKNMRIQEQAAVSMSTRVWPVSLSLQRASRGLPSPVTQVKTRWWLVTPEHEGVNVNILKTQGQEEKNKQKLSIGENSRQWTRPHRAEWKILPWIQKINCRQRTGKECSAYAMWKGVL